ncbi:8-amino-7-oxononanoate synthase [Laceyella tengchongensis]|uniref:8-amino-7-ketopelargonate synthase n=1 Tax=Laceyella tengchongensis TaxID=574699 RepID=A0AA45WPZ2_9BACL|nr:8-amino-7-oxononanoate synthase [Laceyella tengchongensis]SMP23258.1 8-amino-7-oxononanoate synthase [Laceyella tengchongensis]
MSESWESTLREETGAWAERHLLRTLIPAQQAGQTVLIREGRRLLNFSSNNYLGLATHPELGMAVAESVSQGIGGVASRLIIGHNEETEALEREIARFKGTEAALLFPNGYMANLGLLSALLKPSDAVFSDQYNHASIVDGIRLSGAQSYRYRHLNLDHLEVLLKRADAKGAKRKLIVTDSVFSMDGDVVPLSDLVQLKRKYNAALVLDEAHAAGVWGPGGAGMAHHLGVAEDVDLHMGTFSKAFGVYGAYVAGKKEWIQYLLNRCRPLIYTTALPPVLVAAIRASLRLVEAGDNLRRDLHERSAWFRQKLQEAGLSIGGSTTQIVPLIVGESELAIKLSQALAEEGVLAVAIRPPTVPEGQSRLRFSLMATHTKADVERAVAAVLRVAEQGAVR